MNMKILFPILTSYKKLWTMISTKNKLKVQQASFKEARVAGIKNKLRRAEEMKKVRREKKKVCTMNPRVLILLKH